MADLFPTFWMLFLYNFRRCYSWHCCLHAITRTIAKNFFTFCISRVKCRHVAVTFKFLFADGAIPAWARQGCRCGLSSFGSQQLLFQSSLESGLRQNDFWNERQTWAAETYCKCLVRSRGDKKYFPVWTEFPGCGFSTACLLVNLEDDFILYAHHFIAMKLARLCVWKHDSKTEMKTTFRMWKKEVKISWGDFLSLWVV